MSATTGTNLFPHLWKNVLLTGILSVILGVMMLAWPGPTLVVAAIFFRRLPARDRHLADLPRLHAAHLRRRRALLFINGAAS